MRRVLSVALDNKTYLSLGYLVVPGQRQRGVVVTERAMAREWFGANLTPLAPERPPAYE